MFSEFGGGGRELRILGLELAGTSRKSPNNPVQQKNIKQLLKTRQTRKLTNYSLMTVNWDNNIIPVLKMVKSFQIKGSVREK